MNKKNIDEVYCDIIRKVLKDGKVKTNRTVVDTKSISGYMFEWDMADGFPLLTTKKMAWKTLRVELEGFIKGVTDKEWFNERGCKIWNEWCNPKKVPYGHDEATYKAMAECNDLGAIYGFQWRNFNGTYMGPDQDFDYTGKDGVDQLAVAIDKLKTNPNCRRNIVMAWNPQQLDQMALVPCHYGFQLLCNDGVVDLLWNQRSNDVFLGEPFNIASYALLLELIAYECNLKPGKLIGFLADVHIYNNHMKQVNEQLTRKPFDTPTIKLNHNCSIFDWTWDQVELVGYESHPALKAPVAI